MASMDEVSDSNSHTTNTTITTNPNKRHRHEGTPSSSSRFKGVVLQPNGHWGAQIYANHQRIWLGTFKSEEDGAMAYDSAAVKIRRGEPYRNYPVTEVSVHEPVFQDMYSTEDVLNMIRDGSYQSKLMNFLRNRSVKNEGNMENMGRRGAGNFYYQQLFQKELTPSDVGKLNRLVIPKKYAVKYFPRVSECDAEKEDENGIEGIQLGFLDRQMREWDFRYCYWKSSQSFVFTRGWNRFVKEKKLNAKDVVTFYRCEHKDLHNEKVFCMIDIEYSVPETKGNSVAGFDLYVGKGVKLQLGLGLNSDNIMKEEESVALRLESPLVHERKGFRLFGVQIN